MGQRKVVLYIAMSLDGYIAKKDGSIDWLDPNIQQLEEDTTYNEFYKTIDTVVMGRTTYDQVVSELAPNAYPYGSVDSYVLTSRMMESTESIHFINEHVGNLIKKLKRKEGKDIWIVGGHSIIAPLINENLIDDYRIAIIPTILGEGIPLFGKLNQEVQLKQREVYTRNELTYTVYEKM